MKYEFTTETRRARGKPETRNTKSETSSKAQRAEAYRFCVSNFGFRVCPSVSSVSPWLILNFKTHASRNG
jgi:hypothetical protein